MNNSDLAVRKGMVTINTVSLPRGIWNYTKLHLDQGTLEFAVERIVPEWYISQRGRVSINSDQPFIQVGTNQFGFFHMGNKPRLLFETEQGVKVEFVLLSDVGADVISVRVDVQLE